MDILLRNATLRQLISESQRSFFASEMRCEACVSVPCVCMCMPCVHAMCMYATCERTPLLSLRGEVR